MLSPSAHSSLPSYGYLGSKDLMPSNFGAVLSDVPSPISTAAADARAIAVSASIGSFELSTQPRSVRDQRELACCVSCAIAAAMETLGGAIPPLAPLFHYYVTRFDYGAATANGDIPLDTALIALSVKGICRADLHPYPFTSAGAFARPSPSAYEDAASRALRARGLFGSRYVQASGPSRAAWAREQLARERPLLVTFQPPVNYPRAFLNGRFEWLDPNASTASDVAHCVVIVGYSDLRQSFHVQDSRGSQSFDSGRWWLGYRIVDSVLTQSIHALIP